MFSHREKLFDLIFQSLVSASSYTIGLHVTTSFDSATTVTTDGALCVTLWPKCSHIATNSALWPECSHIGKSRSISSSSLWLALPLTLSVTTSFDGATTLTTDGALCVTLWPKCSHIATNSALWPECSHIGISHSISSSSLWSALPVTLSVYRLRLLLTVRQH